MPETELLIKKAESLPAALFQEAVNYIDYLSQKAHTAYVAEKLAEVERDMSKPDAKEDKAEIKSYLSKFYPTTPKRFTKTLKNIFQI